MNFIEVVSSEVIDLVNSIVAVELCLNRLFGRLLVVITGQIAFEKLFSVLLALHLEMLSLKYLCILFPGVVCFEILI